MRSTTPLPPSGMHWSQKTSTCRDHFVKALKTYTLGLKWKEAGSEKPSTGTEIENVVLAAALQEKDEFKKWCDSRIRQGKQGGSSKIHKDGWSPQRSVCRQAIFQTLPMD
jgi:hypothetical protein